MSAEINKNYAHLLWRVPVLLIWMCILPVLFIIAKTCRLPFYEKIPHLFHRGVRLILGLNVIASGEMSFLKPTLYVGNHISYLDVFVLGDIPAYFVAKSEVSGWPILGQFAKFQNTLFIERKAGKAKHTLNMLQQHLVEGSSLILFPEGTSTNGAGVKHFKSSLFEAANTPADANARITIQPITIAYTHQAGQKMNRTMMDHYAWYGDMPFASHFFKLFALKKVDVRVHYHSVCYLDEFETRKQCADHCQQIVAEKLAVLIKQ